jgi:hypothetical protein
MKIAILKRILSFTLFFSSAKANVSASLVISKGDTIVEKINLLLKTSPIFSNQPNGEVAATNHREK